MILSPESLTLTCRLLRLALHSDDLEVVAAAMQLREALYDEGCEAVFELYFPEGHYDEREAD
jgi:hypothetical protein